MRIGKRLKPGDYDAKAPGPVTILRPKSVQSRPPPALRHVFSGEAERKRATWEGRPPFRQICFCQGDIELLENTYAEFIIRSKSAEIRGKFWEGVIPPGVRSGDVVSVVGRCNTANLGQSFILRDVILIHGTGFRMAMSKMLKKYCVAPSTYMDLPLEYRPKLTPK